MENATPIALWFAILVTILFKPFLLQLINYFNSRVPRGTLHEAGHYKYDKELGFPDIGRYNEDPELWDAPEKRAYVVDIDLAKEFGHNELIGQLEELETRELGRRKNLVNNNKIWKDMNSTNPFDNAKALAVLSAKKCFSVDYVNLAKKMRTSTETVAFHTPLKTIAEAYLYLAGALDSLEDPRALDIAEEWKR